MTGGSSLSNSNTKTNKRLLSVFESHSGSMNDDGIEELNSNNVTSTEELNDQTTPVPSKKNKQMTTTPNQTTGSHGPVVVDPTMTPIFKYLPSSSKVKNNNNNNTTNPQQQSSSTAAVTVTPKRSNYVSWDDYFLAVAILSSHRSKDPGNSNGSSSSDTGSGPEGACIVDTKNRIVAVGYSGFPRGCPDTVFPWNSSNGNSGNVDDTTNWLHTKEPYVCHAITNAILNKCSPTVEGCRIYVMKFPSSDSVKMIIQSGIDEVIIVNNNNDNDHNQTTVVVPSTVDGQAAYAMLQMANITVRYHTPSQPYITLDFEHSANLGQLDGSCSTGSGNGLCNHHHQDHTDHNATTATSGNNFTAEEQRAANILLEEAKYDASSVVDNGRRKDAISWDEYFMSVAFLTAQRSKDPNTQVGACIVDDDRRIVGLGYNGMPSGLNDDDMPWARTNHDQPLFNKYLYVCHAEVNAILNKGSADVRGSTLYVALFPCENCAKMIIQAGIRKVVYLKDSYHTTPGTTASRIMLKCAGVELTQYTPPMKCLTINY